MSGTNLPDLGSPPTRLDPELRKWLVKAGEHIRELRGFTGDVAGQAGSGGGGGGTVVIPGAPPPAPAPGPADPPDLTPPPTPSGVDVTAGLNAIYIETDAPTFTQGHGYARTLVYGAKYPGTGPLPTFSSAVLVHEFIGEIGSFPSDLGTQWHIWVKWLTEDNVPSSIASGGTNGHVATTGKIGNADLGPLIVEAGNLASGAVTAAKLAAGAVGLTAFAAGLTPVEIVATLPASGNYSGRTVVLTTDGKLYRYIAGAWTKAVDGADLVANSITTGKIAAGAVTADQLAAGAVRTNKLLVAPSVGGFVNADPLVQDSQAWTFSNVSGVAPAYYPNFNGGPGLNSAWDKNDGGRAYIFGPRFAISADRTYEIKSTLYLWGSSSATFYLLVAFYDAQGNPLSGTSFPGGWPGAGDYHYFGRINQTLSVGYNTYTHKFGANATSSIPAQAAYAQVGVLGSYNNAAGRWSWGGAQVREIIPGELIVDGAITATKIAANAIAVGTAAIQNGAIVNAMIANATIDSAKIASLAVSKLTAGSLSIGAFIQSSGYIPGVTGFRFDGNGFAELGAASIRGQLVASQIDSRGLTIKDASGNVILGAGTGLNWSNINTVRPNLLPNGGFENGLNEWSGGPPGLSVVTDGVWGRRVVTSTPFSGTYVLISNTVAVQAGVQYTVTADTLLLAASGSVYVDILFYNSGGSQILDGPQNPISTSHDFSADGANRAAHAVSVAAPAGAISARVRVVWESVTSATAAGARQVKLERGALPATPYTAEWSVADAAGWSWSSVRPGNPITAANISTFMAAAAIGSAYIQDASITNAKIGDTIQSVGYSPGVSGWFIRKSDGFAEFGAASIRGKLAAGNIAGSTVVGGVYNSYFFALSGGQAVVNQSFTSGIELTLDQPLSGGDYSVQGSITGYLGVITNVSFAGGGGTYMVELAMVFDLQLWNGSSWGTVGQGVYDLQQDIILTGNQTFRFPFHATIDGLQSGLASYSKARILVRVGAGGFKQLAVNGGGAKTDALSSITMFMKDSLRQFPN